MYIFTLTLYVTTTVIHPIVKEYVAIRFLYTLSSIISSLIEERTNKMQRWLNAYFSFFFLTLLLFCFVVMIVPRLWLFLPYSFFILKRIYSPHLLLFLINKQIWHIYKHIQKKVTDVAVSFFFLLLQKLIRRLSHILLMIVYKKSNISSHTSP